MKQRIIYVDLAKALAIVLMILGHCCWKDHIPYMNAFVYSFHMPLFFIVSGFFIKPLGIHEGAVKYAKAYLKPYFLTALCILLFVFIYDYYLTASFHSEHLKDWLVRVLFASGSSRGDEMFAQTPIIGPMWFLFAIFWSCLIFSVFRHHYNGLELFAVILLMFVLAQLSIHKIRLPLSLQAGLSSLLFLWVGYVAREYDVLNYSMKHKWLLFSMGLIWGVCILRGSVVVSHCVYGLGLISVLGAISGSLIFLLLCKILPIELRGIGQHTLLILCVHQFIQYLHYIYGNPFKSLPFAPQVNLFMEFTIELTGALTGAFLIVQMKTFLWKKLAS